MYSVDIQSEPFSVPKGSYKEMVGLELDELGGAIEHHIKR